MADLNAGIIGNLSTTTNPVQMVTGTEIAKQNNINADTAKTDASIPLVQAQSRLVDWQAKQAGLDYSQAQAMVQASQDTWHQMSPQTTKVQGPNGQPQTTLVPGTGTATAGSPTPATPDQDPVSTEPGSTVKPISDPTNNPLTYKLPNTPGRPVTDEEVQTHVGNASVMPTGAVNPISNDYMSRLATNMANRGVRADTIQNTVLTLQKAQATIASETATAMSTNLKNQQNISHALMDMATADPQGGRQAIINQFGVDIATPGGHAYMASLASSSENATAVTSNDVKKLDMQLAPMKLAIEKTNSDTSAFSASTGRLTALVDQAKVPITTAPLIADQQKTAVIAAGVEKQAQQTAQSISLVTQLAPLADTKTNIISAGLLDKGTLRTLAALGINASDGKINLLEVEKFANGQIQQLDAARQSAEGVVGGMGSDARAKMTEQGAGGFNPEDNAQTIAAKATIIQGYTNGTSQVAAQKRQGANGLITTMTNAINKATPGALTAEQAAGLTIDADGVQVSKGVTVTKQGTVKTEGTSTTGSGGVPAKVDANAPAKATPKSFSLAEAREYAVANKMTTDQVVKLLKAKGIDVK